MAKSDSVREALKENLYNISEDVIDLHDEMEDAFHFTPLQWDAIELYVKYMEEQAAAEDEITKRGYNVDELVSEIYRDKAK